jgi:hypothetical protein
MCHFNVLLSFLSVLPPSIVAEANCETKGKTCDCSQCNEGARVPGVFPRNYDFFIVYISHIDWS